MPPERPPDPSSDGDARPGTPLRVAILAADTRAHRRRGAHGGIGYRRRQCDVQRQESEGYEEQAHSYPSRPAYPLLQIQRHHAEGLGLANRRDLVPRNTGDRGPVAAGFYCGTDVAAPAEPAAASAAPGAAAALVGGILRRRLAAQVPRDAAQAGRLVEIQLANLLAVVVGDVQHQLLVARDARVDAVGEDRAVWRIGRDPVARHQADPRGPGRRHAGLAERVSVAQRIQMSGIVQRG